METPPAFDALSERLRRFVAARSGLPAPEAEDVVQDTLLQAWRDRGRFRTEAAPDTWLLAIARHRIIDRQRRERVRRNALEAVAALAAAPRGEPPPRVGLERLSPGHAEVLRLRYLDGLPIPVIAERRGEGRKAVESRLHRAKAALRRLLLAES